MKSEKIFKFLFMMLLVIYLVLFFVGNTEYYDYKNYKKMIFTEEQIKKFENDIENGKEINVEDYIVETDEKYNNKIANIGKKISFTISSTMTNFLSKSFKAISKFISE